VAFRPLTDWHLLPPSIVATLVLPVVALGIYFAATGRPVRGRPLTAVGAIFAANGIVFILEGMGGLFSTRFHLEIIHMNGLVPALFVNGYQWWALFTKMFVHANLSHFFMNMLVLWFVGLGVEQRLGRRSFVLLYLASGIFAVLITLAGVYLLPAALRALPLALPGPGIPNVGASGAIFGLLGFMVTAFPRERFMLIFPFPIAMRAWVLAVIFIAFNLFLAFTNAGIAWWAHLAGMAVGALWALRWKRTGRRVRIDSITGWGSGGPVRYSYSYRYR
jgi:membrane associated rhomboid family serine protease